MRRFATPEYASARSIAAIQPSRSDGFDNGLLNPALKGRAKFIWPLRGQKR
jgi:hypothetical protein